MGSCTAVAFATDVLPPVVLPPVFAQGSVTSYATCCPFQCYEYGKIYAFAFTISVSSPFHPRCWMPNKESANQSARNASCNVPRQIHPQATKWSLGLLISACPRYSRPMRLPHRISYVLLLTIFAPYMRRNKERRVYFD